MEELGIYVAAHKKFDHAGITDPCYKYLFVGAANHPEHFGYICDNSGYDHISGKNMFYCELTGLYWMWKNAPEQKYIGLCHYRRYPSRHRFGLNPYKEILTQQEILKKLQNVDILLPEKGIKNKYNAFCATEADLQNCKQYEYIAKAIAADCPEYLDELKKVFMNRRMCFSNILITSREILNAYCEWLFRLLFMIERDMQRENKELPREYGYLSEWMLNVWVQHNKLKVKYIPIIFTEHQRSLKYILRRTGDMIKLRI